MITIDKDRELYKTTTYDCPDIEKYMEWENDSKCMTNKMLWLSEDKGRALSYGTDLKIFKTNSDIDLWNLMDPNPYPFEIESGDEEFQGKMQSVLGLLGDQLTLNEQAIALYGFLTGSFIFSVTVQLSLLKTIYSGLSEDSYLIFDKQQLSQILMTPDSRQFKEVIKDYIDIGDGFSPSQLRLTNQRLSIYGLDQILLKLICMNEYHSSSNTGVKGWYVKPGTQTVWAEIVNGKKVTDMGEIALFDCRELVSCEKVFSVAKINKKSKKKRTKKRTKKRKRKRKRKYSNKKSKRKKKN